MNVSKKRERPGRSSRFVTTHLFQASDIVTWQQNEKRRRELEREEKVAKELMERHQVRRDNHIPRRSVVLTPPQREESQRELERKREATERFEVRHDSHLFQRNTVPTPS